MNRGRQGNPPCNGGDTPGMVKAWVRFSATASGCTIRSKFNVNSVVRNGTGEYTITVERGGNRIMGVLGTAKQASGGSSAVVQISKDDPGLPGVKRISTFTPTVASLDPTEVFLTFWWD